MNNRIYISHCIRGASGINATDEEIAENCERAKELANELDVFFLSKGLDVDLYVPAEHEEFINIAYKKKYLTEEQILDVDCAILNGCDAVIVLDWGHISRGMQVEINYCTKYDIPCLIWDCKNYGILLSFIKEVLSNGQTDTKEV